MIESLRNRLQDALLKNEGGSAFHSFSEDIFGIKEVDISELSETLYEPALCIILQGAKQTSLDNRTLKLSSGDSVIISHHVPVFAKITQASVDIPYLALIIKIDMKIIRSLHFEIERIIETHIPHPNCHKRVFTEYFFCVKNKNELAVFK